MSPENTAIPFERRPYQRAVIRALPRRRFFVLLWRRQGGKSTILSEVAIFAMLKKRGLTVTYASASLLLGREIVYKEAQVMSRVVSSFVRPDVKVEAADRQSGKILSSAAGWNADDLAELYEAQRLEFRWWHDQTTYSRTQVIAPNVATARSWTGWVILDEFGFIRDFRELMEAVEPIISTDPTFHLIAATTPPKDDAHYSYELIAPAIGTTFPVNAAGNWYESESERVPVHRVDIYDAHLAGVKLYDLRTGAELTPDEHFRAAADKDAWRRNYRVEHVLGGTAACSRLLLDTAQARGVGQCACVEVDTDLDFDRACAFLAQHIARSVPVACGWDLATTTKQESNPSAFAVVEWHGVEFLVRLVVLWKTAEPSVAKERVRRLVEIIAERGPGERPRRLCVDATNERYFARDVQVELASVVPVRLVIASETIERGGETMTLKQHLGGQLVGELEDNHLTLPPERYLNEDFRMVKRERGDFVCEPDSRGRHGDAFDAVKLALDGLLGSGPFSFETPEPERSARRRIPG